MQRKLILGESIVKWTCVVILEGQIVIKQAKR